MRSRRLTLLAALAGSPVAAVAVASALTATSAAPSAVLPAAPTAVTPASPAATAPPAARTVRRAAAVTAAPVIVRAATPARPPAPRPAARPAPVVAAVESPAARGARVLASLGYDWQPLGYRIRFLPARDGLLGLTNPSRRLVEVYVKDSESDLVLAHTIAHELGHVVDAVHGTADRRASYLRLRGLDPGAAWFGCARCTDYATPAGDWAEVFAAWLAGPGDFRSELAGAPSNAQLQQLAPLFDQAT